MSGGAFRLDFGPVLPLCILLSCGMNLWLAHRRPYLPTDLGGETDGKRHLPDLVLQFLDAVDMPVLVLENVLENLPGCEVACIAGLLDRGVVRLDGAHLERVVPGELAGDLSLIHISEPTRLG